MDRETGRNRRFGRDQGSGDSEKVGFGGKMVRIGSKLDREGQDWGGQGIADRSEIGRFRGLEGGNGQGIAIICQI